VNPILHHISMHIYPLLIVNSCHLICTQTKESKISHNSFCVLQHKFVHALCHFPLATINPVFPWVFFTFNSKCKSLKDSNSIISHSWLNKWKIFTNYFILFFGACMNLRLNQVKYTLLTFTHINPFIFVVGSIIIVILISHENIKSSNHNLMMTSMFLESIQLGRQEFVFSINGRTYDTFDLRN